MCLAAACSNGAGDTVSSDGGNGASDAAQDVDATDAMMPDAPPSVADNPPIPAGYVFLPQADVTAAMTTWAVAILNDPADYPMFSTATQTFGTLMVLARVEWHPPDSQNSGVHRGVTLYEPAD